MDRRADSGTLRLGVRCRPFKSVSLVGQPLHRQGSALDGGCHTKVTGVSASVQNRQRGLELVVSKPALYLEDLGRLARRRVFRRVEYPLLECAGPGLRWKRRCRKELGGAVTPANSLHKAVIEFNCTALVLPSPLPANPHKSESHASVAANPRHIENKPPTPTCALRTHRE